MKAWRLSHLGGTLSFEDIPVPAPRHGSVLVRIEASVLMSYLKRYVEGALPFYIPPSGPFTIGTNAVGVVDAVGTDVFGLAQGTRVVVSSHVVARENLAEPAQILIGLTAGAGGEAMLREWPDGTLADYALLPVEAVTPIEGLEALDAAQLAGVSRFIVPYGGMLRGRLTAGETLIVTGATGAYGTAATILAIALGAARVVAAGRNPEALAAVAEAAGPRVVPVALTGDRAADTAALRAAAGGGAQMAFDIVGNARDPNATLSALHALGRNGRLVLMGSMTADLPLPYTAVMLNNWEILGQFMYPRHGYRHLLGLVRSGQLDLGVFRPSVYPMAALPDAMEAAALAGNLEYIVMRPTVEGP